MQPRDMFADDPILTPAQPVTCLGLTFASDDERRRHFRAALRAALEELHAALGGVPFTREADVIARLQGLRHWSVGDAEQIAALAHRIAEAARRRRAGATLDLLALYKDEVGFPRGTLDDIVNLSDPPYYTACPNPFARALIADWQANRPSVTAPYHREPFAADVSEGRNDPIYNAHSYHTKVPHKAIMRYILHYTEPGDLVLDGFCGTGMTGVAAQLCGDRAAVTALGYQVDAAGYIYRREPSPDGGEAWQRFARLGARRAVLNDLSPAATFIAYNYNTPVDADAFAREARRILADVEQECGWMYTTFHQPDPAALAAVAARLAAAKTAGEAQAIIAGSGLAAGQINYTVWSDVFICPNCAGELIFWQAAVDHAAGNVRDSFACPHCAAILTKRSLERAWVTSFDPVIGQTVRQAKQVPVLINYSVGRRRYDKAPDALDLALIAKLAELPLPYWVPHDRMPEGYNTEQPRVSHGLTHVHHFYTKRNLWVLSALCKRTSLRQLFLPSALSIHLNKMRRYQPVKPGGTPGLPGTLYISAISVELSLFDAAPRKLLDITNAFKELHIQPNCIVTQHAMTLNIADNSIDYIFTDPPFGGNLMYSELNFLWEAWLKVFTNPAPEAIENRVQGKGLADYQRLMTACFREYYRVLKPGRWMTVEFHNSHNAVWNAIQEALQAAGFVVADVRTLDKQQGSFKQVTSANAVKQDLIISCYKPNGGLEEQFQRLAGSEAGVWEFVRAHLSQLPVFVAVNGNVEVIAERQAYLLFDRMVAFHVQRGVLVPLSASEFYAGLAQRFPERDGMYFLPDQAAEYDRKRLAAKEVQQLPLFVTDEASAIQWLKRQLARKPQTFQELHPQFTKELAGWHKHEKLLELRDLLEQNFLCYTGDGPVPGQLAGWLKQSSELRDIIQRELAAGRAREENGQLVITHPQVLARAKDRWYVPDPNRAADLEKLRERALLREFEEYKAFSGRRLKVFRLEAVRAGFRKAWQAKDYRTIIEVAAKLPEQVLHEDPKLLMWYDQAQLRMEG